MSWIYTEADYYGIVDDNYRRYPFLAERGARIDSRFSNIKSQTCWIAGCGWGFLVEELITKGWNSCWGFDASTYAVNVAAPREIGNRADRVVLADALSGQSMRDLRRTTGQPRTVITEDLLPTAANEGEAQTMLSNLRSEAHQQAEFIHIITPRSEGILQPDGSVTNPLGGVIQISGFLWLSPAEWRALIGPSDQIFLTGTYEEVP